MLLTLSVNDSGLHHIMNMTNHTELGHDVIYVYHLTSLYVSLITNMTSNWPYLTILLPETVTFSVVELWMKAKRSTEK